MQTYHNPESRHFQPDVSRNILESAFVRQSPTGLVFLDWKELITAHCFVTRPGLRISEDVSMILLNDPSKAEWFHLDLARFRFPIQRLVTTMVRWLENGSQEANAVFLSADFIPGNSIAPAKDK